MIAIRPAEPRDAPALAALRYDFRSSLSEPAEPRDAFLARCGAWMERTLRTGEWRAWVAERDGVIVGQIWLQIVGKLPNPVGEPDRHGYLSNLYVRPDARGGTGTKLLEAALACACEERVDRIVLWPTALSRSLYRRYGFAADGDVLEKIV